MMFFDQVYSYFTLHAWFNGIAHFCAGFGIAVLLQHYFKGNCLFSTWFGWFLLAIATGMHVYPLFA